MLWLLALASLPIGFFGFFFEKQAETTLRSPIVIGTMLIVVGLVMWYADKTGHRDRGVGRSELPMPVDRIPQASPSFPVHPEAASPLLRAFSAGWIAMQPAASSFSRRPAITAAAAKAFHDLYKQGGICARHANPVSCRDGSERRSRLSCHRALPQVSSRQ